MLVLACLCVGLVGCTQNQRAKEWGGTADIKLPPNQKLVNVGWEETHLWVLTRPMRADETPEQYLYKENSSWGMLQGSYNIYESR